MKSIALHVPVTSHHAGFWTLLRGLLQFQPYRSISRDQAQPMGPSNLDTEEIVFFQGEDDLEDYLRSFRD